MRPAGVHRGTPPRGHPHLDPTLTKETEPGPLPAGRDRGRRPRQAAVAPGLPADPLGGSAAGRLRARRHPQGQGRQHRAGPQGSRPPLLGTAPVRDLLPSGDHGQGLQPGGARRLEQLQGARRGRGGVAAASRCATRSSPGPPRSCATTSTCSAGTPSSFPACRPCATSPRRRVTGRAGCPRRRRSFCDDGLAGLCREAVGRSDGWQLPSSTVDVSRVARRAGSSVAPRAGSLVSSLVARDNCSSPTAEAVSCGGSDNAAGRAEPCGTVHAR